MCGVRTGTQPVFEGLHRHLHGFRAKNNELVRRVKNPPYQVITQGARPQLSATTGQFGHCFCEPINGKMKHWKD